jgi:hypothetical protein
VGSFIECDDPFVTANQTVPPAPIIWYGTSILQGGVTLKVRTDFLLSKDLIFRLEISLPQELVENCAAKYSISDFQVEQTIITISISILKGNGKMELNVASFLTTIPNPAVFIIDCR